MSSVWPVEDRDEDDETDVSVSTIDAQVRYVSPDQVESWGLFRWRTS